jgi:N-acetylneuraminate synthase
MSSQRQFLESEIIGEIGLSHEGSLGLALSMIKACKKAGLDYAKFQYHSPFHESTKEEDFRVRIFPQDLTRRDYWERTSFSRLEWKVIYDYCKEVGIKFLCTPFSVFAASELLELGVREVKIGSGDALNFEILEFARENFNRVFVSLGFCKVAEIQKIRDFFHDYSGELVLMQCTSEYPADVLDVGLTVIDTIEKLGVKAGLSDHTGNAFVPMSAIAYGASFVEFHVVFDNQQFGPDSLASLTFKEAKRVVDFKNTWFLAIDNKYDKDRVASRLEVTKDKFGRGISVVRIVKKGETLSRDLLTLKKPRGPLDWDDLHLALNKRTKRDLYPDEHIGFDDFE